MKKIISVTGIFLLLLSCKPKEYIKIKENNLTNDTIYAEAQFDTLHRWRKKPGQKKTVKVKGYYKNDSTYVNEHYRTKRE